MKRYLWGAALLALSMPAMAADLAQPKLITNRSAVHDGKSYPITETPLRENVYDLSFVAYDSAFADEFSLDRKFVGEMDKGLRWMEVSIRNNGQTVECHYNAILDKGIKLAFPDETFRLEKRQPDLFLTWSFEKDLPNERYRHMQNLTNKMPWEDANQYNNKTYLARSDYAPKPGQRGFTSLSLDYLMQDRSVPYTVVSASGDCYFEAGVFQSGAPALFLAKNDSVNYNIQSFNADDFLRFAVPSSIVTAATPHFAAIKERKRELMRMDRKLLN